MNQSEVLNYIDSQIRSKTQPNTISPTIDASVLDAIVKMDMPSTDKISPPTYGEQKQLAFSGRDIYYWDGSTWNYIATGNDKKSYSFFITTQGDGTMSSPELVDVNLLKIEGYGTFYYLGLDFTKDPSSGDVIFNSGSLLPGAPYLVLTAPI